MSFLAFYLSGVILVFTSIFIWNRLATKEYNDSDELSPEAFSLPTALMASLSSWGIVFVIVFIVFFAFFFYLFTGTEWAKKANKWFTKGTN
jgi:predicted PurR-regulated permease PerM